MTKNLAMAMALALALAGYCRADSGVGAGPFDFLSIDANARAAALGGAYTALAADSNALLYNPAGLGVTPRNEAAFTHNRYIEGVTQEHFSLATRYGLGASVNYLSFGGIPRTTISRPAGTGVIFGLSDMAASGGYGREVGGGLSLGAAYKYISEHVDDVSATGHAFDAGALWIVPGRHRLSLGAAVQNMGTSLRFQQARERLPLAGRLGAAYSFDWYGRRTTLSADGFGQRHGNVQFGFGAETIFAGVMALRAGYTSRNKTDMGLTAGAGWKIRDLSIDYAVVPFGDFGLAHRMSATFRWGAETMLRAAAAAALSKFAEARSDIRAALAPLPPGESLLHILCRAKIGRIARLEGDLAQAQAAYKGELGLNQPGVPEALLGMGLCLLKEGSPKSAAEYAAVYFRRVLELTPKGEPARRAREQLARLEGERKGP